MDNTDYGYGRVQLVCDGSGEGLRFRQAEWAAVFGFVCFWLGFSGSLGNNYVMTLVELELGKRLQKENLCAIKLK